MACCPGECFMGTWRLVFTDENFEEYMKKVGVGMIKRKLGLAAKPDNTFSCTPEGQWTIKSVSTFKTHVVTFKLNEPSNIETPDGRVMKATFTLEGDNKLIHKEEKINANDVDSTITRVVTGDEMEVVCECGEVKSTRRYQRHKEE